MKKNITAAVFLFFVIFISASVAYTDDFILAKSFFNRGNYARAQELYSSVISASENQKDEFYYSSYYDLLRIYIRTNETEKFKRAYEDLKRDSKFALYAGFIEDELKEFKPPVIPPPLKSELPSKPADYEIIAPPVLSASRPAPRRRSRSQENLTPPPRPIYSSSKIVSAPRSLKDIGVIYSLEAVQGERAVADLMTLAADSLKKGDYNSAETFLKVITDVYLPSSVSAHYNLGAAYYRMNKFADAEKSFLKALVLNKDHISSLINLGAVYFEMNQPRKAKEYWLYAVYTDPGNELAAHNLQLIKQ